MLPNLNFSGMSLLIVDEDIPSARRLATAMARRGFKPFVASSIYEGAKIAASDRPAFALVELRLPDGNGLDLVKSLCEARPNCRVVVLTSFGSVESAVTAVKLGATDYLVKPSSENVVLAALLRPKRSNRISVKMSCRWIESGGSTFSVSLKSAAKIRARPPAF